jgi:hypothetical protein
VNESKTNILNNFFTKNTFYHCYEDGQDKIYDQVISRYIEQTSGKNNLQLVSEVYSILKKYYRNEYFYKNTLLNKLLLGVHSVNTTTALTEVPIANSKADFVLINGKAVVYEIKTELDNLERVESQINDYYKAFDHVAVVTYNDNVEAVKTKIQNTGKPVGIYSLQRSGTLKTILMPETYRESLDTGALFKLLRKPEYESIIIDRYGGLPDTSDFKYYSECRKLFVDIPLEESYDKVLKILKKRSNIIKPDYENIPYELKFLAYFMSLKEDDYKKIDVFLNDAYGGV